MVKALDRKDDILEALGNTSAGHQVRIMLHQAETAERTIEELEIDEQEDALKLLAWLVLLNENNIWHDASATPPFSLDNAVSAMMRDVRDVRPRHYENYGIVVAGNEDGGTEGIFILTEAVLRQRIRTCEAEAATKTNSHGGKLSLRHPIPEREVTDCYHGQQYFAYMQRNPHLLPRPLWMHTGLNFAGESAGVFATMSGTVARGTTARDNGGYGIHIWLGHHGSGGLATIYGHLARMERLRMNEFILAGKYLVPSGTTGTSTNILLHYEVRLNRSDDNGGHDIDSDTYVPPEADYVDIRRRIINGLEVRIETLEEAQERMANRVW